VDKNIIDADLEKRMRLAQDITSMVLSLRKKERLRVRQPLQKIMIPVLNEVVKKQVEAIKDLVLAEVNVKELEFMTEDAGVLVKKIKPNFKSLGPKYGKHMRAIAAEVAQFTDDDINKIETENEYILNIGSETITLQLADVEISSEDIPGWTVTSLNGTTVALDINITDELAEEGLARELINRIQNLRKDSGLEVTDRIEIILSADNQLSKAIHHNLNYICSETLADELRIDNDIDQKTQEIELVEGVKTSININRII
jgi:isoleucyl-tRNA synthetase